MIVISDDGSRFALYDYLGIKVYDAAGLSCLFECETPNVTNSVGDFSKDSKLMVNAVVNDDMNTGTVTVYETDTGNVYARNKFDGGVPISITLKNDGYAMSLCDVSKDDKTSSNYIRRYDMEGNVIWTSEEEAMVYVVADYFGDSQKTFFTYQPNLITVWDDKTGDVVDKKPIAGNVMLCQKECDGKYILVLSEGNILEYVAKDASCEEVVNYDVFPTLNIVEAVYDEGILYTHFRGTDYISVYTVPEGTATEEVTNDADGYVPSKDEVMFANAISNGYMYDETYVRPEKESYSMAVTSPDKQWVAFYGDGKEVRMYSREESTPKYKLSINTSLINYMFFSEDSGWFVVSYQNGDCELYDVESGELVKKFEKDYPYVMDAVNIKDADTIIIDCAYETRILDGNYNIRTTYKKTGEAMCVGYDMAQQKLILKSGNSLEKVSLQ